MNWSNPIRDYLLVEQKTRDTDANFPGPVSENSPTKKQSFSGDHSVHYPSIYGQKNNRSDNGENKTTEIESGHTSQSEQSTQKSADHSAQNTNDNAPDP